MGGGGADAVEVRGEGGAGEGREGEGGVGEDGAEGSVKTMGLEVVLGDADEAFVGGGEGDVFEDLGVESTGEHLDAELAAFDWTLLLRKSTIYTLVIVSFVVKD